MHKVTFYCNVILQVSAVFQQAELKPLIVKNHLESGQ